VAWPVYATMGQPCMESSDASGIVAALLYAQKLIKNDSSAWTRCCEVFQPESTFHSLRVAAGRRGVTEKSEEALICGTRASLSISSCRFYCLSRLKHSRTLLSRTRVTTERDRSRITLQSGQASKPSHQSCQIGTVLFIDRCELQSQSAAGLHVPHNGVGANLALLNEKMKISRRANALWSGGLDEQSAYTEILHARQITISAAFPVDPHIVLWLHS
jgi:hypothetical protein